MLRLTSFLSLLLLTVACAPHKLLEKGKTSQAFERAASQAERNPNAKIQTLDVLAQAYTIMQESDYNQVSRIGNSSSPTRWEGMVEILDRLERRRRRVSDIRLRAKRVMHIDQASEPAYAQELVIAKREAAAHLLREGKSLLALAENGDMLAAREAFASLERRDRYAARTTDINSLIDRAVYLGTMRVALDVRGPVSDREIDRIGRVAERTLSGPWVNVYPLNINGSSEAHLIAEIDIDQPYIAPPIRNQTQERFSRVIEERKKVGVDTSGSPIYKVEEKTIKATVFTKTISRESIANARLSILNAKTGSLLKSRDFNGVYVFEDFTTRIRGNEDALNGFCPPNLNKNLLPPPSIFVMEDAALEALSCAIPRINLGSMVNEATFVAR